MGCQRDANYVQIANIENNKRSLRCWFLLYCYTLCVCMCASWKDLCQWDAFAYKSNKVSLQRWIYTLGKTQKTSWIKKKICTQKKKKRMTSISHCYLNHKTLLQRNSIVTGTLYPGTMLCAYRKYTWSQYADEDVWTIRQ